ncbi:MAG: hypothetical protein ABW185_05050 [Sedimenticola sp.]
MSQAENMFSEIPKGSFGELSKKIDTLVNSFANFKAETEHKEEVLDRKIEEKIRMMLSEEREIASRKMNLLVFNIKEAESDNKLEQSTHDMLKLNDLINELGTKTDISEVVRLGREGRYPRPLRFRVLNFKDKSELLSNAKSLKSKAGYERVFLSPDRTPREREEYKKLVTEMKARRDRGENVRIFGNQVKPFPVQRGRDTGLAPDPGPRRGDSGQQPDSR